MEKGRWLILAAMMSLILVGVAAAAAPTFTTTSTADSISLNGLKCGTNYKIRLQTYKSDGTLSATTAHDASTSACAPPPPPPPAACADGLDNDSDGKIDYPADPGCTSASDTDETDVVTGNEPAPIAGQGYHQVFADEFNTLNRAVWDDHIWYDDAPDPRWAGYQTVHDGELDLMTSKNFFYSATGNWPINTVTTQTSGLRYQYGYFETRMRWTGAKGAWPGFWLYSYQHAIDTNQCATQAGEIDVMEGQGVEPNVLYGTVHSNTNGCSPYDNQNGNNWQPQSFRLADNWHKYAATWTPSQVSWFIDDKLVMSAPTYATDNQPMFVLLQMWVGGWSPDPDNTTPDLHSEFDYVHIWQK
jgi:beta-glucanase (GH16 family)